MYILNGASANMGAITRAKIQELITAKAFLLHLVYFSPGLESYPVSEADRESYLSRGCVNYSLLFINV